MGLKKGKIMYTNKNYKTKKELKTDVEAGVKVGFHQPGPFGGSEPKDGRIQIEGPRYPQPHRWYAECEIRDGYIVKVK